MMKFKKIMLSVAAVTAVTAAMAISAMAADTITGTYDATSGEVTMSGVLSHGDQTTLLVLTQDSNNVTEDMIAQIDQDASITSFKLAKGLTSGTYYIRVGGSDGNVQTGTLTIGGGSAETVTIVFGQINSDARINTGDATALAQYTARIYNANNAAVGTKYDVVSGTDLASQVTVGNINLDARINTGDATALAQYTARIYNSANQLVGTTLTVTPAE